MNAVAPGPATVVIMAKRPVPGRTKTRLCPPLSFASAAALHEAMLNDTIALVGSVPTVRLAVAVSPASSADRWRPAMPSAGVLLGVDGPTIGACLDTAITALFRDGHTRVLALNSDGPTLPPGRIEAACTLLDAHDVVVGPSEDGGYYLLALKRPRPALFRDVPWSTPAVAAITIARARAHGLTVAQLEPWYDVDTPVDLDRLRSELATLPDVAPCSRRFFAGRAASLSVVSPENPRSAT